MTEDQWAGCADPLPMLEFMRGEISPHKQRLFVLACFDRARPLIPHDLPALDPPDSARAARYKRTEQLAQLPLQSNPQALQQTLSETRETVHQMEQAIATVKQFLSTLGSKGRRQHH